MSVNIMGKEYHTVSERINALHTAKGEQYEVLTDIHTFNPPLVIVRAMVRIHTESGIREYTGHAYEMMDQGQINSTSALENCETSAIGRALSAAGYGGTEYASANEVENAIHKQEKGSGGSTEPPSGKPNKYAGKCDRCGLDVAADAGFTQKAGDKWIISHGECPTPEPPNPEPVAKSETSKPPTTGATKGTTVTRGSEMYPCSPAQYKSVLACLSRMDLSHELREQASFLVDNPTIKLNTKEDKEAYEKAGLPDIEIVPNKYEVYLFKNAVEHHIKTAAQAAQTAIAQEEVEDELPF